MLNRAAYGDGDNQRGDFAHAQQIARQLWHQAGGYYPGKSGPPPTVWNGPVPQGAYMAARPHGWADWGQLDGAVTTTPRSTKDLLAGNPGALAALIHEFTHTRQAPAAGDSVENAEGGADAFTRAVGPGAIRRSGLRPPGWPTPYLDMTDKGVGAGPYDGFVRSVLEKLGRGWVMNGQFNQ